METAFLHNFFPSFIVSQRELGGQLTFLPSITPHGISFPPIFRVLRLGIECNFFVFIRCK